AISTFLVAYNRFSKVEMILSKIAAVAGLGVALFPCKCDTHTELIPHVHGVSAAVMFLVMAYFCYGFYQRASAKGHQQAKARAGVYAVCGVAILISIIGLAFGSLLGLSASIS